MQLQQVPAVQTAALSAPLRKLVVWDALDADDVMTAAAGRLYEETLSADERIPWEWIERSVRDRAKSKPHPRGWRKHLLLAAPDGGQDDPHALAGYVYGALIPNYGGYLCYVGVAPWARGAGVGRRLYEQFFHVMRVDAGELGEPLPFVIWESHRPGAGAGPLERENWEARTRLFDRAGGRWVEGVEFLSPNFAAEGDDSPPVPLQLFVKPVDLPEAAFTADKLREVVGGLHERVYRNAPGTAVYDATLPPGCEPRLRPARAAGVVRKSFDRTAG